MEEPKEIEETETVFQDSPDEEIVLSPQEREIYTKISDPEIISLYNEYKSGNLVLQPNFQRQYVWDASKASKLIESAILQIPLPTIYLSEQQDETEHVIDGQQRLTSFFAFIDGYFPDNSKPFKLSSLTVRNDLNGKQFKDLAPELQRKVRRHTIHTITFPKGSSENLKFEIFERLNTGSVQLNAQELRNCLYRGPFNLALIEMAKNPDFMYLCSFVAPDKRMRDVELVLRFSAFYHKTYLNYKPPMKIFLNEEAREKSNLLEKELEELKEAFKNACYLIRSIFDKNAFYRFRVGKEGTPNGDWETKQFNYSLYDVLMDSFAREDKNKVYPCLDSIREALIHLMTEDQEFMDSIERSTSSKQAVMARFDKWRQTLAGILGTSHKEPRYFSRQLKEQMMKSDPTCTICQQHIHSIDDAAIDHIKQYWMGGKTIPENARLTHRYCNSARPRNDVG
jgi:Protein of unknown function DUF262/HNH endonuclease